MNQKTYCPLGKIDCKRFLGLSTTESYIRCGENKEHDDYILLEIYIELCPIPSKQQKIERFDMCEDQTAQIKCFFYNCIWYKRNSQTAGVCENISPAIIVCNDAEMPCKSFKPK